MKYDLTNEHEYAALVDRVGDHAKSGMPLESVGGLLGFAPEEWSVICEKDPEIERKYHAGLAAGRGELYNTLFREATGSNSKSTPDLYVLMTLAKHFINIGPSENLSSLEGIKCSQDQLKKVTALLKDIKKGS